MTVSALLTLSLAATAAATPGNRAPSALSDGDVHTASRWGLDKATHEEDAPLYMNTRGSLAVPANGSGDVVAGGVGLGVMLKTHQQIGLRFIYMHDPPENPLARNTPSVPWAWGPVLDWQYTFKPDTRASMFVASSLGYVYGTPEDGSNNVILPILEGGVGLRLSKETQDGRRIYAAPQLGFVPGAVAPFTALDIGIILPGGRSG